MKIEHLLLSNYRNIVSADYSPSDGINVIYGENAQGKTNILEAIWMLSGCRSFRSSKDSELVRFGCEAAKIEAGVYAYGRSSNVEITIRNSRRVLFNSVEMSSPVKLIGEIGVVIFAPSLLQLISGSPAGRRKFADTSLCQIRPAYARYISEYNRALAQRNALLKSGYNAATQEHMDVWDEKLSSSGEVITAQRKAYTAKLSATASRIYEGLSGGKEELSLVYEEKNGFGESVTSLKDKLKCSRQDDIIYKTTCTGPHRDDIAIYLDGKPARYFGSQGQMRSAAVAMKLAEAEIMTEKLGESPVILLDDVMSELDEKRQDYILNHIENGQVFITCCDSATVSRAKIGKTVRMEKGSLDVRS